MALVTYENSDNESTYSDDEEGNSEPYLIKVHDSTDFTDNTRDASNISDDEDLVTGDPSISTILDDDVVEEEYKMRIPASAVKSSSNNNHTRKTVKLPIKRKIERPTHFLSIPSIDQFDSSDEEDEVSQAKKKLNKSNDVKKSGSGLLTLLPQPKSHLANSITIKKPSIMVPLSVSRPKPTVPITKPKMDILPSVDKKNDESTIDDSTEQTEGSQSFFSFFDSAEENRKISNALPVTTLLTDQEEKTKKQSSQDFDSSAANNADDDSEEMGPSSATQDDLMQQIMDSDRSLRRLKGQPMAAEFVDVNQADLTAGAHIELTKGITDQSTYRSEKSMKQAQPGNKMAGRKHQITWLAFKAKEREFELQNMWADNRQTKKQTQSKYGF